MRFILLIVLIFYSLTLSAQTEHLWTKSYGGNGWDYGTGVAIDAEGNIYSVGRFANTVDFDPGTEVSNLTAVGSTDIYIQKLDAEGNFIWSRAVGGSEDDVAFALGLDGAGNVYLTGNFLSTVDFDPGVGVFELASSSTDDTDAFILKLDADGNFQWAKQIASDGTEYGYGIAVDEAGNSYATGYFSQTVDLDPGSGTNLVTVNGGTNDFYVVKLDTNGEYVWGYGIGGEGQDRAYAAELDKDNLLICGHFGKDVDFDPTNGMDMLSTGTTTVALNGFLMKMTTDGNYVGTVSLGSAGEYEYARSVKADAEGNIYCTGYFKGTMDVDPDTGVADLVSNGGRDVFLVKYTPALEYIWGINAGGGGNDYGRSLAVDKATGTAFVAASQYSSDVANWGTDECFNEIQGLPGTNEILVLASYDSDGNPLCVIDLQTQQQGFYSAGYQSQMQIRDGALFYLANYSSNNTDFDPGTAVFTPPFNGGSWDVALSKYQLNPFSVDLGDDFGFCDNAVVELDATSENATYFWQDGSTDPIFEVTAEGTYSVLVNSSGCIAKDEVMGTENQINTTVVQADNFLVAQLSDAEYQWVNCPDFAPLSGETDQAFEATQTGEYAVILTSNACVDTSECFAVMVTSLEEFAEEAFNIFPNPVGSTQLLQIEFQQVHQNLSVQTFSMDGKLLQVHTARQTDLMNISFDLPAGIYLLEVRADDKVGRRKVVCEE
ncbi:MAG: SBBP repeat-containing protein [Bacteroidota bacterium]